MNIAKYLEQVSYTGKSDIQGDEDADIYYSKFDGSYMGRVGMESHLQFLADREITDELTHGVGFSPKDKKWYGWSHRAIYGFEIGSTCSKGDCHYHGSDLDEQREDAIRFWADDWHKNVRCDGVITNDEGERFFDIIWEYSGDVPNEKLRSTTGGAQHHIKPLGRGEWLAKTMEDAKQMAVDFNEGVS